MLLSFFIHIHSLIEISLTDLFNVEREMIIRENVIAYSIFLTTVHIQVNCFNQCDDAMLFIISKASMATQVFIAACCQARNWSTTR